MGRGTTESFVAGVKDVGVPSFLEIWHADPFQKWNLRKVVLEKFESSARYVSESSLAGPLANLEGE